MVGSRDTGRTSELSRLPSTVVDEPIAGAHLPPAANYRSLARSFLLRLCVAVTLGLVFIVAVEMFSYRRGIENQNTVGPEVEAAIVDGTAEEREYWKEQQPSQKVQYEPYVLWRRASFNGSAISINADGIRRTLHTHTATLPHSPYGCSETPLCGAGAVPTRRQSLRWWRRIIRGPAGKSAS